MDALNQLAEAIRQRDQVEERIATIVGRPLTVGALNEFVACRIFQIVLDGSAADIRHTVGRFSDGPLAGRSVAVRWIATKTRSLDIAHGPVSDYILVITGSSAPSASLEIDARPWLVERVYLFDARQLAAELEGSGVGYGSNGPIDRRLWQAAEIYPRQRSGRYLLSGAQRHALGLFGPQIKSG